MVRDTHRHLYLVIPSLFRAAHIHASGDVNTPSAPALETLLARAVTATNEAYGSLEAALFALFGVEATGEDDLPVASVTRVLDMGVIDQDWWIRADPVHLRPEQDRLILIDSSKLEITEDEASSMAAEIMGAYADDGWLLKLPRPDRWYLKPSKVPAITTTPLPEVGGRDIHAYLPQGKDGMTWHGVLNEIQILLHTANANVLREQQGKLPVNSVWFWGGGRLPKMTSMGWTKVWSEEPVSLALARLSETPTSGIPQGFLEWQLSAATQGDYMVVLDRGRNAAQHSDFPAWSEFLGYLEREWMAPLFDALKNSALDRVTLISDNSRSYSLTPRHARRWWRRRRPLQAYR